MRISLFAALVLSAVLASPGYAGLRAGADITDITPLPEHFPISTAGSMRADSIAGTDEKIHCRTLMLGNEKSIVSFTIVDSCVIPRDITDAAKRMAAEKTGVPAAHLTVAASHTHSAPAATAAFQSNPLVAYQIFLAEEDRGVHRCGPCPARTRRSGLGGGRGSDPGFQPPLVCHPALRKSFWSHHR